MIALESPVHLLSFLLDGDWWYVAAWRCTKQNINLITFFNCSVIFVSFVFFTSLPVLLLIFVHYLIGFLLRCALTPECLFTHGIQKAHQIFEQRWILMWSNVEMITFSVVMIFCSIGNYLDYQSHLCIRFCFVLEVMKWLWKQLTMFLWIERKFLIAQSDTERIKNNSMWPILL